jgi:hypothetical protein
VIDPRTKVAALISFAVLLVSQQTTAQRRPPPEDTRSPREAAPIDLTGYWVSVITEDWRWRMQTPPKGDYASVPLNDAGRNMADTWDPEADEGTCRPYGAAGVMRMPLRIHVSWDDEDTLRVDTDHGMQTRLFEFDAADATSGAPSLQGDSLAAWDGQSLKVVTRNLEPGYLRRNGVPYSADTVVTEFFDRHRAYDEEWITVTTIVDDPVYLRQEFITSSSFKQLADDSSWHPVACEAR